MSSKQHHFLPRRRINGSTHRMDVVAERTGQTGAEEALTRVDNLWFPDHNLVLQAGNRLFRVSGGILAARSSVFRDMLSIPQPESQPLIDGCPIILLHDSAIEAEYFLKALFDSRFSRFQYLPCAISLSDSTVFLSVLLLPLNSRLWPPSSGSAPNTMSDFFDAAPCYTWRLPRHSPWPTIKRS